MKTDDEGMYNTVMTKCPPSFTVFVGSMFSSKTSSMLALLDRYTYQKKSIVLFKPKIDDRFSEGEVCTHSGWKMKATCVETGADILKCLSEMETCPDVVGVDELFMVPGSAKALIWLFRQGVDIVVASIDLYANMRPCEEVMKVMPFATQVTKCHAVCVICGRDAAYSYKKTEDVIDDRVSVGGEESYESRCSQCMPGFRSEK